MSGRWRQDVIAAERKTVRPSLPGSYEAAFHHGPRNFFLDLQAPSAAADALEEPRLERAIGVVYLAEDDGISGLIAQRDRALLRMGRRVPGTGARAPRLTTRT